MERIKGITHRKIVGENMKDLGNKQFKLTKMEAQLWVMAGVQAREKSDHEKLSFKCHLKESELYP